MKLFPPNLSLIKYEETLKLKCKQSVIAEIYVFYQILKYFWSTSDNILRVLTHDETPPWPEDICHLSLPVTLEIVKHQLTLQWQNTYHRKQENLLD